MRPWHCTCLFYRTIHRTIYGNFSFFFTLTTTSLNISVVFDNILHIFRTKNTYERWRSLKGKNNIGKFEIRYNAWLASSIKKNIKDNCMLRSVQKWTIYRTLFIFLAYMSNRSREIQQQIFYRKIHKICFYILKYFTCYFALNYAPKK